MGGDKHAGDLTERVREIFRLADPARDSGLSRVLRGVRLIADLALHHAAMLTAVEARRRQATVEQRTAAAIMLGALDRLLSLANKQETPRPETIAFAFFGKRDAEAIEVAEDILRAWPLVRTLEQVRSRGDRVDEDLVLEAAVAVVLQAADSTAGALLWEEAFARVRTQLDDDQKQDLLVALIGKPLNTATYVPNGTPGRSVKYGSGAARNMLRSSQIAPWRKESPVDAERMNFQADTIAMEPIHSRDLVGPLASPPSTWDLVERAAPSPEPHSASTNRRYSRSGVDVASAAEVSRERESRMGRMQHRVDGTFSERQAAQHLGLPKTTFRRLVARAAAGGFKASGRFGKQVRYTAEDLAFLVKLTTDQP